MESYDLKNDLYVETPTEIKLFIIEIINLSMKYKLSIAHEDGGAFLIQSIKEENLLCLMGASLDL